MRFTFLKSDENMILYAREIKHKNWWKKLVRLESNAFHDLSQVRKWCKTRSHNEILWFDYDLCHTGSWFESCVKPDSNQTWQWKIRSLWFDSCTNYDSNPKVAWFESGVICDSNHRHQKILILPMFWFIQVIDCGWFKSHTRNLNFSIFSK